MEEPVEESESSEPSMTVEALFRAHSGYVARVALRILGNPSDVDDVVQDVFMAAAKGLHRVRDPKAVRGWLATITVRVARRRLRHRKARRFFGLDELSDYSELLPSQPSSEHLVMLSEVYRVLDGLPAQARIAWILRHVEGEPLEIVAEYCGISRATAHRRVVLARTALEEAFDD